MEMNTRLQVEHPVTEMVTGLDIVREQLRDRRGQPAVGHPGGRALERPRHRGAASTPRTREQDFRPSPGRLEAFELGRNRGGPGVRVDTHLLRGRRESISPHYDSLVAKVIAHGATRERGDRARMLRHARRGRIEGVATTIPLHQAVLPVEAFQSWRLRHRPPRSPLARPAGS